MKIDYNWGNPPVKGNRFTRWLRTWAYMWYDRRKVGVPLHMSNHYVREHFHPEDDPQAKLF